MFVCFNYIDRSQWCIEYVVGIGIFNYNGLVYNIFFFVVDVFYGKYLFIVVRIVCFFILFFYEFFKFVIIGMVWGYK